MTSLHASTPSASPAPTPLLPAQRDLLTQLAVLLEMPADHATRLVAPSLIEGPIGLACRLHLQPGQAALRPEVLLPLHADEFSGASLQRLFAVQSVLLGELGWYLGLSPERLISLSPMDWADDAESAALTMDLANGLGSVALRALIDDEQQDLQEQPC